MNKPESHPVWWTVLGESYFEGRQPPCRSALYAFCFKCQNWFDARAALGGHPVLLEERAGKYYKRCLKKLKGKP